MLWKGFQKPKRLATDTETLTDKYGHFWAQPFERGFGTTIGNALRRVLLSSIEGAAVTAVKIEGVLHEFQSIPGVVEDATDIILNLKQIPFRLERRRAEGDLSARRPAGRGHLRHDRSRRRCGSARQGRLHRDHQRRRQARHGNAAEEGPRLRFGRQELRRGPRVWDSFRSTRCTRRCASAITRSKRLVWVRSPTTTSWPSKSGPTARSRRATPWAWPRSC